MNIPGYDAWRLSGPPEWEGPTCDWCGSGEDIRVRNESYGRSPMMLICAACFTCGDDGPDFDDLQTANEYEQERADLRADHLHDEARDRKGEG